MLTLIGLELTIVLHHLGKVRLLAVGAPALAPPGWATWRRRDGSGTGPRTRSRSTPSTPPSRVLSAVVAYG
jgi:hypothetical protein